MDKSRELALNQFSRASILDIATVGVGILWAVLSVIKYVSESLFGQISDFNILRTFYVCLIISLANLVDGLLARYAARKSRTKEK